MSQNLTHAVAVELKRGDIIYSNLLEFVGEDGKPVPAMGKVMGRCKPHPYYGFALPVKRLYGSEGVSDITGVSTALWRTVPEKLEHPPRIHRTRPTSAPASEGEDTPAPAARVRRTRPAR